MTIETMPRPATPSGLLQGDLPGPLAAALVAALSQLVDVAASRTANAGTYSYRYADLSDVLDTARPVLHEHGLAQLQLVETEPFATGVHVSVRTLLVHTSGASLSSPSVRLTVSSTDPQRVGSAVTYARRYSLMATLGVATEDDDAQSARAAQPAARPAAARAPLVRRTEHEARARELLDELQPDERTQIQRAFRERFGVSLSNLERARHEEALAFVVEQIEHLPMPDAEATA